MAVELTHKERIDRILSGQDIDRPVISMWRHFYHRENNKDDLVNVMLEFQRKFDWDFMKINSRASYHIEDWGATLQFSNDQLQKPEKLLFPIREKGDWKSIGVLDWHSGALGETLAAVRDIIKEIGHDIYCLPTVFSPLSIAADLVGNDDKFIEIFHDGKNELRQSLEAITATFTGFVTEAMSVGAAGIFFATTEWASRELLSEEEYLEFGMPYDLQVLNAAHGGVFNIIHVCNKNNMLPLFRDYPGQVLSWNPFDPGNLSIHQASQIINKIFLTGIDQNGPLAGGPRIEIKRQIEESLKDSLPGRLMIGPGCAIKVDTPDENIQMAIDTVKGWKYE